MTGAGEHEPFETPDYDNVKGMTLKGKVLIAQCPDHQYAVNVLPGALAQKLGIVVSALAMVYSTCYQRL